MPLPPSLPLLTPEEIASFVANGFLVKRSILSQELCAAARDRLWAGNTSASLRRDDPSSWRGIPEAERESTLGAGLVLRGIT
jgi:hypothetical protein